MGITLTKNKQKISLSWHSKSKYALFKQGANNQLLIWFSKSILNHISGRVMVQLMPLIFTIKKGFKQVQKFHKISHYTLTLWIQLNSRGKSRQSATWTSFISPTENSNFLEISIDLEQLYRFKKKKKTFITF